MTWTVLPAQRSAVSPVGAVPAVCPVGWDELRIRAALLSRGVCMGGQP